MKAASPQVLSGCILCSEGKKMLLGSTRHLALDSECLELIQDCHVAALASTGWQYSPLGPLKCIHL